MRGVAELIAAYSAVLDRRADGTTLQVMGGPHVVPTVGVIADIAYIDDETLDGPRSVVLLLAEHELGQADAALERLAIRVASLGPAELDVPLAETLGLAEIEPGTELPIEHEASVRHAVVLDAMRARHAELSPWTVPPALVSLAALFASPSTFERAALARFQLKPSGWLAAVAGMAPEPGALLTRALRSDRAWRMPPELVPLFDDYLPGGAVFGFWYDEPAAPQGPAVFCRGDVQACDGSLLDTIARWIDRELAEPGLDSIELDALRAAVVFFARAAGDHRSIDPDRPIIASGIAPAVSREHGEPRWSPSEVAARKAAYQADDAEEIARLIAVAERELGEGKPAFALILGHELYGRSSSTRSVSSLLVAAYAALGRGVYADLVAAEEAFLRETRV